MVMQKYDLELSENNGGPLYYFGNRNLTLPNLYGRMEVDASWLKESFAILLSNRKGEKFNRCFEPFAGSAAWSFAAMELGFSQEYFINDGNKALINFFRLVKEKPNAIKEIYAFLVRGYKNSDNKEEFFKKIIGYYNTGDDIEKSQLISFIVNYSWGGMVFYDEKGSIVYRCHTINGKLVPGFIEEASLSLDQYFNEINRISNLLNNNIVHLESGDFEQAISEICSGDFVVLNPPYPENERSLTEKFGLYVEIHPCEILHEKLCSLIEKLEVNDIAYFMSYGLYNPKMKKFLIRNFSNLSDYYLRLIGSENCIFGRSLDQVYFNKKFQLPEFLNSKLIRAYEVLDGYAYDHEQALEIFSGLSIAKTTS